MDEKVISEAIRPDVLRLLHQGKINSVLSEIESKPKNFLSFFNKSKIETHFAYEILRASLKKTLKPKEYKKVASLNFGDDFFKELNELFRVLLVLKDCSKESETEELIAQTLLEVTKDGAAYIAKNSNDYPKKPINGKTWFDGAGLRTRADELSEYFEAKRDDIKTLEALYLRAQLTNTVMSHYPHFVGPDMIAVAMHYEKMGNTEKAKDFFNPVVLDFVPLVQEAQKGLVENDVMVEDIPITESLINALEGLKRLGEDINEDILNNAKLVLKELKEVTAEGAN